MSGSNVSADAEEGGAGSDDESALRGRGLLIDESATRDRGSESDPRWSRMIAGAKGWRLRGVEWRVKLGILPAGNAPVDAMRRVTADGRRKYADLRRRLLVDPHTVDDGDKIPHLMMDNPLSLDPESVWGRYFRNAALEKTIDKDLTRLYPEHGIFFQSAPCQAMMRRILLVWSLIHPQISYRQGMHELLAPLLYVLHVDVVRLSQVKHRFEDLFDDRFDSLSLQEQHVRDKVESAKSFCGEIIVVGDSINFATDTKTTVVDPEEQRVDLSVIIQGSDMYGVEGELGALLSARFLEHDAYCMLEALLGGQDGAVAMADYFKPSCGWDKPPVIEASGALYRTLAAADICLYTHLVELGVEPQFFALRWLRLLFGREFVLEDLLRVWDVIFEAENTPIRQHGEEDSNEAKVSKRGALISSFSVSMLLYVRLALLAAPDVTACLQRLLKFPQVPDVGVLIESAKSLQFLALAAVKLPGIPVPRNTRTSEMRGSVKHVRSGSISPPATQRHVIRPQNSMSPCPDVLRVSMSLPGSYWEEKWTHSVLHKTPEELFSPGTSRMESVPRGSDNVDSFNGDASDDGGQEMLRRGGEISTQEAIARDSSAASTVSNSDSSRFPRASEGGEQELREHFRLNPEKGVSLASTSASEPGPASDTGVPHDNSLVLGGQDGPKDSQSQGPEVSDDNAGSMDSIERDQVSDCMISVRGKETKSTLQYSGPVQLMLDTVSLESSTSKAAPASLSGMQGASPTGTVSLDDRVLIAPASVTLKDMTRSQISSVLKQSSALQSESTADLQPIVEVQPGCAGNESLEMKPKSQDEESKGDDTLICATSSESSGIESRGDQGVEDGIPRVVEPSLTRSKSKPPLPPGRLGRFNWMWSLGRNSVSEKAVSNRVSKEDTIGTEIVPNLSGNVVNSDVSSSNVANAAQRRKKSWWRANSDVVPENLGESTSIDSGAAVDSTGDVLGTVDLVKPIMEPAVGASEVQVKEDVVADIPVTSEDAAKKPKDMTPSAALQALGQSVLEHVQVLESALAQKVSGLGIETMMWSPAVREKSESTNKGGAASKGQGAALTAIAELRKISQALQQM